MQLLPVLGMGASVVFFFSPQASSVHADHGHADARLDGRHGDRPARPLPPRHPGADGRHAPRLPQVPGADPAYGAPDRRGPQRDAQLYLHPAPEQLWSVVAEGSRVWERRAGDEDFGQVRWGSGRSSWRLPWSLRDTAPGRRAGAADRGCDAAVPGGARHARRPADGGLAAGLLPRDESAATRSAVRGTARALVGSAGDAALPRGPGGRRRGRRRAAAAVGVGEVAAAHAGTRAGRRRGHAAAVRDRPR